MKVLIANDTDTNFRFKEDRYLEDVANYIAGTYGQHYAHEIDGKNIQVVDLWEGMGSLLTTSRDTAIKYLTRFGRKGGHNEKDLHKAIHYVLLMLYAARNEQTDVAAEEPNEKLKDLFTQPAPWETGVIAKPSGILMNAANAPFNTASAMGGTITSSLKVEGGLFAENYSG